MAQNVTFDFKLRDFMSKSLIRMEKTMGRMEKLQNKINAKNPFGRVRKSAIKTNSTYNLTNKLLQEQTRILSRIEVNSKRAFDTRRVDRYSRAVRRAQTVATGTAGSIRGGSTIASSRRIGGGLGGVIPAGYLGMAGLGMAASWSVRQIANLERDQVFMGTLLGNRRQGKLLTNKLMKYSARTPYTPADLTGASRLLLGYGMKGNQIMPAMKQIGNIAGGDSMRFERIALAYAQILTKGKLEGQEVRQLGESGFNPLKEMARTTGQSFNELRKQMEAGKISFDMVRNAFDTATSAGGRFEGVMEDMSKTLSGTMNIEWGKFTQKIAQGGQKYTEPLKKLQGRDLILLIFY